MLFNSFVIKKLNFNGGLIVLVVRWLNGVLLEFTYSLSFSNTLVCHFTACLNSDYFKLALAYQQPVYE
jgi:hypothetical protein